MLPAAYTLIPLAPLLASIIIALAGSSMGEKSRRIAVFAIGTSLAVSIAAFIDLVLVGEPILIPIYEWLRAGDVAVEIGLYVDQLTVLLLLLVTGVSFIVHVYAGRYMTGDARYSRFFAVTTLFTFAMVALVMSSNLLIMFMSWEIMGICSYLLISHQSDRPSACSAATKAFLVNAVADVGLLFGIVLAYATFQTLDIREILLQAPTVAGQTIDLLGWAGYELPVQTVTLITLFLFMGCLGKSAQMPFHVWLPNAMEAPTPVSALIHAATMVNAGPFLLVRFSPLIVLSPTAMTVIAIVGATTALFAAVVSLTQSDIKKMLAYSTISQIGFMIMTCGVGAFAVVIFHMLAHGFLKGFLFLSTGSQLETVGAHAHDHSPSDRQRPPWSLYLGALILACVPAAVIFSGPYERLWIAQGSEAGRLTFWILGLLTVFFTAAYLFRGVATLFNHAPGLSVKPRFYSPTHLLAVAAGALALSGVLIALWIWFAPFLAPALPTPDPSATAGLQPANFPLVLILPLLAVVIGWAVAYFFYLKPDRSRLAQSRWAKTLYVCVLNKFYFDEIYSVLIVRPVTGFSRWLFREVDVRWIDGVLRNVAMSAVRTARWMWVVIDVHGIDRAIDRSGRQSVSLARRLWQTIDVRVIDQSARGTGSGSLKVARWLWKAVDVRQLDHASETIGQAADATGKKLRDVEPRTLQHHLLVLITWLIVAIVFLYWLVL